MDGNRGVPNTKSGPILATIFDENPKKGIKKGVQKSMPKKYRKLMPKVIKNDTKMDTKINIFSNRILRANDFLVFGVNKEIFKKAKKLLRIVRRQPSFDDCSRKGLSKMHLFWRTTHL